MGRLIATQFRLGPLLPYQYSNLDSPNGMPFLFLSHSVGCLAVGIGSITILHIQAVDTGTAVRPDLR
jgi:hypothetical protein